MFGLCKYKNIFGKPDEGIHRYKIFNIAIIDVFFTIIIAIILNFLLFPKLGFFKILLILFLLSIVIHHMFCVRTPIDKFLFPQ